MKRIKKESYIEKYEKNLILFGLFAFIILGVVTLVFLLPKINSPHSSEYFQKANEKNSIAAKKGENNPEANYKTGIESFKQNNYSMALDYFQKAVKLDPDNMNYLSELAITHYRLKNYDEAIKAYEKMIGARQNEASSYNSIGNIYWIKKNFSQAEFYFQKAIEADPYLIASYNNLSLMFYENGEKEKAMEILNLGIEANPGNPELKATLRIIGFE